MSEARCGEADPGCRFAHPGYEAPDPVYTAIAAHARAYAAYDAQQKAEPGDEETPEPLIEAEWAAAEAVAATVPTTLAGMAAALDHVRLLRERNNYMLFDGWHCYVFIGSAATAMRAFIPPPLAGEGGRAKRGRVGEIRRQSPRQNPTRLRVRCAHAEPPSPFGGGIKQGARLERKFGRKRAPLHGPHNPPLTNRKGTGTDLNRP